jgi:hypothetical protein
MLRQRFDDERLPFYVKSGVEGRSTSLTRNVEGVTCSKRAVQYNCCPLTRVVALLIVSPLLCTVMTFAPKPGCPMCGIVATAAVHPTTQSPRSPSFPDAPVQSEILWRDENFTAYRERAHPVSSNGHIIIAFKYVFYYVGLLVPHLIKSLSLHVPSIYTLVCKLFKATSTRQSILVVA